jgi:hypothetical protein
MQFDIDMQGVHASTFMEIRRILLSYSQIKEQKHAKQTSYSDEYGVVAMMRSKKDELILAFGRGTKLQKKYPALQGLGKVVRYLRFKRDEEIDETLLREMIEESFVLGIEAFELKRLHNNL